MNRQVPQHPNLELFTCGSCSSFHCNFVPRDGNAQRAITEHLFQAEKLMRESAKKQAASVEINRRNDLASRTARIRWEAEDLFNIQ